MKYKIIAYNTKKELTQDNAELDWIIVSSDLVKINNISAQSENQAIEVAKSCVSRNHYRVTKVLIVDAVW